MKNKKYINVSSCFNQPIFSQKIIESDFYSELQKNGWCEIVEDQPDKLINWISIKQLKVKKASEK